MDKYFKKLDKTIELLRTINVKVENLSSCFPTQIKVSVNLDRIKFLREDFSNGRRNPDDPSRSQE